MFQEAPLRAAEPDLRWTLNPCGKHINHGSFGAVPVMVQREQQRLREIIEWNPVRWYSALAEKVAAARVDLAQLLGVPEETAAFVLNASAGASVVYQRLITEGPAHVVVTNHGYGAVSMGAERLAARTRGTFRTIEIPLSSSPEEVLSLVQRSLQAAPSTLLVIDQITSATARAFPTDRICDLARQLGVRTLVDGAHAPGVIDQPVVTNADWWVGNLHKFACAPRGAAILYSRDSDQQLFPIIDSWGGRDPFPARFDHTGTLDTTSWLIAPFAWRHLDETIGWPEIRRRSAALADAAVEVVAGAMAAHVDAPVPDVGMPVGPMRLVRLPDGLGACREDADALRVPFIDQTGIALSFTSFESKGYLRLSTHVYNSIEDFEYLAKVGVPLLHQWSLQTRRGT